MPKHPLFDTSRPGTSIPTRTAAPGASPAFPKNVEPRGAVRTGPPPRAERASVKNMFNRDSGAVSKRPPMKPPSRVR